MNGVLGDAVRQVTAFELLAAAAEDQGARHGEPRQGQAPALQWRGSVIVPTQGAHLPVLTYFQRRKPYSSVVSAPVSGSDYRRRVPPTPATPAPRALLDASSTPLLPAARDTLLAALDAGWADPRRLHAEGRQARALLDRAREVVAAGLGVRPPELSFLPSGPVALRAGCEGLMHAGRRRGARLVASAVEHSGVLTLGRHLAATAGDPSLFEEVRVDALGRVDLDALESALARPGTTAAAVQSANGEVGTRQPLAAVHQRTRAQGVPLLVDAMASLGREPVPTSYDVLVGDARSWGGPGGVGVLVVPERTRWRRAGPVSELEGGRTDAEPVVALALAAAEAWQQSEATRAAEHARAAALVDRIRAAAATIPDTEVVGDPARPAAARGDLLLPVRRR